jgi:hypothetical protein
VPPKGGFYLELFIPIIIFIVISSIIRSISQPAPPVKPVKRSYPDPRGIPERGLQRPGGRHGSYGAYPGKKVVHQPKQAPIEHEAVSFIHDEMEAAPSISFPEPEAATDTGITTMLETENTRETPKHKLDFSHDSLINGIILSEVLGPPLSRRRQ